VPQLIASGSVQHAFLGVQPQTVNGVGVKVVTVQRGSAAAKAGLQAGDVITSLDGAATPDASTLREVIALHKPGEKVTVTIKRDGSTKSIEATLGTQSTS
jgi:S1-C subfamily serine protease